MQERLGDDLVPGLVGVLVGPAGRVYASSGIRVANVFGAFDTADFTRQDGVPRNVARVCQWTWQCAAPPRGPNQHANQAGYQVIAHTFLKAADLR